MKEIKSNNYSIYFSSSGYTELSLFIKANNYSQIFIHLDDNTQKYCLEVFLKQIQKFNFNKILSKPGEKNKNIKSCVQLWDKLSELSGVVGDMGGFIASTFKRGIDYINIPTTLLSMVDASVGGKTGIDLGVLKNQIGTFYDPKMVIVDPLYLDTLNDNELISGYAEIFKHSIISSSKIFNKLISANTSIDFKNLQTIRNSIKIKNEIVLLDKKENKERKALNFGHTLGHAIESYFLKSKNRLLHGEAIAIGIVLASHISSKLFGFSSKKLNNIKSHILSIYNKVLFDKNDIDKITKLLVHDKKNSHGKINFVLIKDIGKPVYDIEVDNNLILKAFKYYSL
jgi:3-dehydroquinate synthase